MKWPFKRKPVGSDSEQVESAHQPKQGAFFEAGTELPSPEPNWHMADLRARITEFLSRPVPAEIQYVPDSITETFMRHYLAGTDFDSEMIELLYICAIEAENAELKFATDEAKDYFRASGNLIKAILVESSPSH